MYASEGPCHSNTGILKYDICYRAEEVRLLADIESPPPRPSPERRGSDTSLEGAAKTIGGCCVGVCTWPMAVVFILASPIDFMFNFFLGLGSLALGIFCAVLGYYACKTSWETMQ